LDYGAGYSYTRILPISPSHVQEYKRKAQGISPQQLSIYSASAIQVSVRDLEAQIAAVLKWSESKDISPRLLWSLFALSIVLAEVNIAPPLPLVLRVLNADFDNTWAYIQLGARLQAVLYSLRMLKQVAAVWLATTPPTKSKLQGSVASLHEQISTFPSISDAFVIPGQTKQVLADHDVTRPLVEEIFASAGVEVPTEIVSNKKKKRQAREAERKKRKVEVRQAAAPVENNYAVLRGM
jgi:hypothetical protein